jgi:PAS domain-containing protein
MNVTTGVFIIDPGLPNSPIIFVNPVFPSMTGFTAEEVLGRNWRRPQGPEPIKACLMPWRIHGAEASLFRRASGIPPGWGGVLE